MAKMKMNIYFFVNAEFYRVVRTINAPLTVRSEMLQFSGNDQHIAIGYVHNDKLPLGNIAFIHYVIQNNCRKV